MNGYLKVRLSEPHNGSVTDLADVPEVAAQKANEHLDKLWDVVLEQRKLSRIGFT